MIYVTSIILHLYKVAPGNSILYSENKKEYKTTTQRQCTKLVVKYWLLLIISNSTCNQTWSISTIIVHLPQHAEIQESCWTKPQPINGPLYQDHDKNHNGQKKLRSRDCPNDSATPP